MVEQSRFVMVLTTMPSEGGAAHTLARALVERRLAACVNVLPPMQSIYWWKEALEQGEECQLVMKTTSDRVPALQEAVRELHPYDVPELLVVEIAGGDQRYLDWIQENVRVEK